MRRDTDDAEPMFQDQRWHPEFRRKANRAHRTLIAACRAGDVDNAAAALAGHAAMPVEMTEEEGERLSAGGWAEGRKQGAREQKSGSKRKQEEVPISEGGR